MLLNAILIAIILGIFFPEGLLISQYQLFNVSRLYDIIENTEEMEDSKKTKFDKFVPDIKMIKDYIQKIPDEFISNAKDRQD